MIAAFVIWSLVSAVILGIGIRTWRAKQPVAFFPGVKPAEVTDVRGYNHAVAAIWFAYAAVFELMGVPLLLLRQNSAWIAAGILGAALISVLLPAAYNGVLSRFGKQP